jgi:hypothetical protein
MDDLSRCANVKPDVHDRATLRPYHLALQAPGYTGLVEDLHAVSSPVDMQMKAFAAPLTLDVEEETVSRVCCVFYLATAEEASKKA